MTGRHSALAFALALLVLLPSTAAALNGLAWSRTIAPPPGQPICDAGLSMDLDDAGCAWVVCWAVDLTGGLPYPSTLILMRFDPAGTLLSRYEFPTTSSSSSCQSDLTETSVSASADRVVVTAGTSGSIDLGSTVIPAGTGPFVATFDFSGNLLWANQVGSNPRLHSASLNSSNQVLVGGSFTGTATIGTETITALTPTSREGFVVSYAPDGSVRWVRATRSGFNGVRDVACDPSGGGVIVAELSPLEMDGYSGLMMWISSSGDATGAVSGSSTPNAVALEPSGAAWSTGRFLSSMDFGPFHLVGNSFGYNDGYTARGAADHSADWLNGMLATTSNDIVEGLDVAVIPGGGARVAGTAFQSVDLGGESFFGDFAFLVDYAADGTRGNVTSWPQAPAAIAVDSANSTWVLGAYFDRTFFGGTSSQETQEVVLAKLPDPTTTAAPSPLRNARQMEAFPNPFNPRTSIRFELESDQPASLVIYDARGTVVRTLIRDDRPGPGVHRVLWDGLNDAGTPAASGVYFARLETGEQVQLMKLALVR